MPKLMSMKDFLARGGPAVTAYNNKGILPSYVGGRPKNLRADKTKPAPKIKNPRPDRTKLGSPGKPRPKAKAAPAKKKTPVQMGRSNPSLFNRATPMKKKKKMPTKKRTMPKY
jgi:hypothetical protein